MIPNREFNKGIWNIVAELKRAASMREVPYQIVNRITEKLESLLKENHVFDLNVIPSRESAGALLGVANMKWADNVPGREPRESSPRDKKLLKSLQFWIKLARDLNHKRRSENNIASSLGLSLEELLLLKNELKEKGWLD
jgi:hypothetical protein